MCRFPYTLGVGVDFWSIVCYNERQDDYKHEHLTHSFSKDSKLILHELYKDSTHILNGINREYIYIYLAIFNGLIIRRTKHSNKVDLSLSPLRIHQIL